MNLRLPIELASTYRSTSQKVRVITEGWAASNVYCPACPSNNLVETRNNTEAVDFICPRCESSYQLKATKNPIGRKITDAGYDAMMRAISRGRFPHILLLRYHVPSVCDLLLIPSYTIGPSAIEARKPLSHRARRAGWVGCNILLDMIPPEGRISMVSAGRITPAGIVRRTFETLDRLGDISPKVRGWTLDVLTCLRSLEKTMFTIRDAYSFEVRLAKQHPVNLNVRAKIRQQLQVLRDLGYLDFVARGVYRWKGKT